MTCFDKVLILVLIKLERRKYNCSGLMQCYERYNHNCNNNSILCQIALTNSLKSSVISDRKNEIGLVR